MKAKKSVIFVFILALFIFVTPFFAGCNNTIKLERPSFVNYQVNTDTGEQMLITENNIFAEKSGGWIFGISTVYENNDTSNFFTYKSNKPYLYVTDILVNAQTYYFYAQAIGSGEYSSSDITEVNSVTISYKLDAPVLQLNGTMLSWTSVQNAQTYIIYANDVVVTELTSNYYDIADYVSSNNSSTPLKFTIACKQHDNYLKSAKSNAKTYTDHLNLSTPTNLQVKSGSNKVLTWSSVKNCNKYEVVINNSIYKEAYSNQLNVSEYYTDVGVYSFKVKAVGEGYFKSSDYSEVITDVYTKSLDVPANLQSAIGSNYIKISWLQVENASEYALYLNGTRFYLNTQTGINSPITTNSVIINNEDLTDYDTSNLQYQVQAIAATGGYYTNSALSSAKFINTQLVVLDAPVISLDETNGKIVIIKVDDAQLYQIEYTYNGASNSIYINATNEATIYFDYLSYFSEIGDYTIKVKAVSNNELLNSAFSNEVAFSIVPTATNLQAPNLNSVYVDGDNLVFDFDKVDENSQTFSLYINNTLLTTSISQSNSYISLDSVFGVLGDVDQLNVCLLANSTDEYHLSSKKSNIVTISTSLSTPTNVKLNGSMLSWNAVENAQTYFLILDNEIINLNSNSTSVNLTNYVQTNKTRQIKLFAHTKYFDDSAITQGKIFNNVSSSKTGYTDKYFFYGETYDYYITSQEELNNLIRYAVQNLIPNVSFYIAYDTNTINSTKIDEAFDNLTGTYGFSASSVGSSSKSGECSIDFNYASISTYDGHAITYNQYSKIYQYKSTVGRDSDYDNFASDKWFVSQDVYTSDGLVVALENSARPNFIGSNSSAQQVYNKAKQILIEICDDSMTDYQKALAIHDYIVFNTSYDDYGLANTANNTIGYYHYIESVFDNGFAVCDGYAKAFSLLCNMEGIKTITISGASDKNDLENTGHAWNKIYLDADGDGTKEWLSADLTWDDSKTRLDGTVYELLSHEYFMIPDDYIGQRYEKIDYPQSTTYDMTYYDIFTIDGKSIKIDTVSEYFTLSAYFKSSGYTGIEILLDKNISAGVTGITTYTYSNYFDENYKRVYLVK